MRRLRQQVPNERAALARLEKARWGHRPACPECAGDDVCAHTGRRIGEYDCRRCGKHFNVRTGTIFENSHIPLRKWMYGIHLLMTTQECVSILRLSKEIGVTQQAAWRMLHRLRLACGASLETLREIVEADEAPTEGRASEQRAAKRPRPRQGSAASKQTTMPGMREHGGSGETWARP